MKKYKQKTRKSAAARFKVTGTGKVMRRRQNSRHLRRKKSKKTIRKYRLLATVTGKYAKKVKQMMGLA
ncbi:MAG: 50S ribosomal protein L35 [Candidatus Pacebacteria bacterium]|jgi:large subunit ribosomal protein L35|nr:50S ribosomal protein L35 [Candidatus Paceibacterota bacterium]MBT3511909.1 50S ribosomal protein L35 [Candidatus Paceibacterota bacterium]MBT4005231.1 50S ribosomal protein L35 [Candidatus Paceibacterota bacterium]MBT4358951.1 50S ribosomal protein L35 [Candidatus Paceibacterota bacterium]MBT4680484.1 50S ribosomal protein L35 [Candidatus Paceibacterota bacterium]